MTNPIKWVLLGLILLEYVWMWVSFVLSDRQLKKPLPASVRDIYDADAYQRWLLYRRECRRLSLWRNTVMTVVTLGLFAFDVFALLYRALGLDGIAGGWGGLVLMLLFAVFGWVLGLPFDYVETFRVEEAYGFNTSTRKTFWMDRIKNLILEALLDVALLAAVIFFYHLMGLWLIVGVFAVLALFMVVMSMFSLPFQRLFNHFTPLEDGPLKQRLLQLFTANGYAIHSIYVMDASRRTTRANAFCAGLGKQKKIALYDNLVNHYTEDEITAVFAHELGHAKHRDTLVMTMMQLAVFAVLAICIGLMVATDAFSVAMGFPAGAVNVTAVMIALLYVVSGPLLTLVSLPAKAVSRRMERHADRFAAQNGLGAPLVSSLKRLVRDNFGDLNPHPVLVCVNDSHPSVAERIECIQEASGDEKGA